MPAPAVTVEIDPMAQASTFGQRVGQYLHLRDAPPSLITRSMRGVDLAVTETQNDNPVPGLSGSLADEAYLVSLKLQDYAECELWAHGKCVTKADVKAGTTWLYDLRHDPRYIIDKPYHSLQFYLPRSALDGIADRPARRALATSRANSASAMTMGSCVTSAPRCWKGCVGRRSLTNCSSIT
ncbi:hypothetical protein AB8Z38_35320 [Bradyrhizobium sp. LLZ17]|uniref:Uncharacterized protein n=1 Tax=Bradyrhizobium sp. LLZ17 TaxID=3239388 RepID=A0AB39XLZ5_9BRAD